MDIHVVRAGETVSSVAARYGVPAGILAGVNGIAPDAPLAVGQTLVVRRPRELHTVASGESVYSIALHYGLSVRTLYQNNPALGGRSALYPGQTLVIAYDDTPTRTLAVNAYSYPFIRGGLLDAALPYLTYLTPFTYGINADGTLLPLADEWLLAAAGQFRTAALMHLSTLTEEGRFDNARSTLILEEADAQDALVQSILETVQARHYFGLDVDFEYVLPEQREAYAAFITRLREALNPLGCPVIVALAPKTSAAQAPYYHYTDRGGREHAVWFEDARSIEAKLHLADEYHLQGVGYWNLARPFPQNWAVLASLFDIETLL